MFSKVNYINNILHYDGVNLTTIAEKYGTPIYIYSKNKIVENYNNYKNAFEKHNCNNYQISFAMKANENLSIIQIIKDLGGGIDAVSIEEIKKAIYVGFDTNKIVFSGVGKTQQDIEFAIKNNIGQINVESLEELLDIVNISKTLNHPVNIGVRINPNIDAHTNEKITTGKQENKFGIQYDEIDRIMKECKKNNLINLQGISVHIGSQILDKKPFEKMALFLKTIYNKYNCFTTIDFGGGLGIQYSENDKAINCEEYIKIIMKYFNDFSGKIIIEPGRSIIGNAGIFLTKIIRIKKTKNKNFIIVDGGMNNLIRPAMYGAFHYPMIVNVNKQNIIKKYDIVGPICESSDVFVSNFEANLIDDYENNFVAFLCSGAYGSSMSSDYNLQNIAGEILIDGQNILEIKKAINWKDFLIFENHSANHCLIEDCRKDIDEIDEKIVKLLAKRFELVKQIGKIKKQNNIAIIDKQRFHKVLQKVKNFAKKEELSTTFINKIYNTIHEFSCELEK